MGDWQFMASRLHGNGTEEVLDWDVPISGAVLTSTLSGPDAMSGSIQPEIASLKAADGQPLIRPWATAIYAIKDGRIRNGCIVTDLRAGKDKLTMDGTGFAGYVQGLPSMTDQTFAGTDPLDVVRWIWSYAQGHKRGNLGLALDSTKSPRRTGTKVKKDGDGDGTSGEANGISEEEQLVVSWQNTHDLGKLMDDLAVWTPFDYREDHYLESNSTVSHHLHLGYPRLGRRLDNLRFVVGENVIVLPDVIDEGGDYADEVFMLGAGEGKKMVRRVLPRTNETRLRRPVVVSDRSLDTQAKVDLAARVELNLRKGLPEVTEVRLLDHPHAPLGAVSPGDEILLQTGPDGWQGDLSMWLRVLEVVTRPDETGAITLSVARVEGV